MNKFGIFVATILAAAGACCGVEARAADAKTCTGLWDFIETDCQLTWYTASRSTDSRRDV